MQLIFQRDEAEDGGGAGGHGRGWRGRRVERIRVQMQARYGNSTIASLIDNIHDVTLPGLVTRAPCTISPYHYRLDWLMWFAAFQNYQQVQYSNILSSRIICQLTTAFASCSRKTNASLKNKINLSSIVQNIKISCSLFLWCNCLIL